MRWHILSKKKNLFLGETLRRFILQSLGLSYSMYIYMTFSNLKNKLACSQFKFTYLIIYISPSKLKPKQHGLASLFFFITVR